MRKLLPPPALPNLTTWRSLSTASSGSMPGYGSSFGSATTCASFCAHLSEQELAESIAEVALNFFLPVRQDAHDWIRS